MTVMNITVIQATPTSATSKAGKPYRLVEVAYKNNTFGGKIEEAKINQYSALFKQAVELQPGQTYEVNKEKDASGYFQWLSITPAQPSGALRSEPSKTTPGATTVASKSTYETPEERAKKQVYIVKQSSLAQAVSLLSVGAKVPPSTELVLQQAQKFVDFVFDSESDSSLEDLTTLPNDTDFQVE